MPTDIYIEIWRELGIPHDTVILLFWPYISFNCNLAAEAYRSMPYSWEEVKQAVERNEDTQLGRLLAAQEIAEGHVGRRFFLIERTRTYLELLGGMVVGLHVAVMTLVFNYLLFVWILHVNFDS